MSPSPEGKKREVELGGIILDHRASATDLDRVHAARDTVDIVRGEVLAVFSAHQLQVDNLVEHPRECKVGDVGSVDDEEITQSKSGAEVFHLDPSFGYGSQTSIGDDRTHVAGDVAPLDVHAKDAGTDDVGEVCFVLLDFLLLGLGRFTQIGDQIAIVFSVTIFHVCCSGVRAYSPAEGGPLVTVQFVLIEDHDTPGTPLDERLAESDQVAT